MGGRLDLLDELGSLIICVRACVRVCHRIWHVRRAMFIMGSSA